MKIELDNETEFELLDIENMLDIVKLTRKTHGVVYSWKTEGRYNWLERGFSVVDVLGLTIQPHGLPNRIDLPDDR